MMESISAESVNATCDTTLDGPEHTRPNMDVLTAGLLCYTYHLKVQ